MGAKIRLALLLVLAMLVAGTGVFLAARPATPAGYRLEFRFEGPYPAEYPALELEGEIQEDAIARMLTQIPGQANMVAVITAHDGRVRQEWRWQNGAWKRSGKSGQ